MGKIPDFRKDEPREHEVVKITIAFEKDILDWLRQSGRGYQKRLNRILRWYMEQIEAQDRAERKKS